VAESADGDCKFAVTSNNTVTVVKIVSDNATTLSSKLVTNRITACEHIQVNRMVLASDFASQPISFSSVSVTTDSCRSV